MTVKQIADRVAKYLQQTRSSLLDDSGGDLVIAALNNARKDVEKMHDFNYCQGQAWVSVDPATGGALTSAALVSGDTLSATTVNIQRVDTVYLQDSSNTSIYYPLYLKDKRALAIRSKEISYRYRGYPSFTNQSGFPDVPLVGYPGDRRNVANTRPYQVYVQNNRLYLDPRPDAAKTVKMDVLFWLTEYLANTTVSVATSSTASASVTLAATAPSDMVVGTTFLGRLVTVVNGTAITLNGNANQTISSATSVAYSNLSGFTTNEAYTDWFVDAAASYLQWAAICEVNMITNTFVPRQEGYNSPPEKMRDASLAALIEWDNFLYAQGQQLYTMR